MMKLSPGVNFNNILRTAFSQPDPKCTKKTFKSKIFFMLSGSLFIKGADEIPTQVVKIARFVSVYGILPTVMTIGNIFISSKTGYKPHGSSGSFLIIYGIVIPLSIILHNQKLKSFAKQFIHRNTYGLIC